MARIDFSQVFGAVPTPQALLDRQFRFLDANPACLAALARPWEELDGTPMPDLLPDAPGLPLAMQRVFDTGQPETLPPIRLGPASDARLWALTLAPVPDATGQAEVLLQSWADVTGEFTLQQRQKFLVNELNHRVKNALATVHSIATQTLRNAPDMASARVVFESRLLAFSKAHSMLSERHWVDADLEALMRQEVMAYGAERLELQGQSVSVNSKATIAMALVLHELVANAVKHGALSRSDGRIAVALRREGDRLIIDWTERGGPPVKTPSRRGFGSRLIGLVIEGELGGTLETRYQESGFAASIAIPVAAYDRGVDAIAE